MTSQNISQGAGKLIDSSKEIIVKLNADALNMEELSNILVKPGLKLKEIARIEDGLSDSSSFSSFNGNQGVSIEVKKISGEKRA